MSRLFVIGDIHGAYRALRQCLDRSGFDRVRDRLICLGDVCDGWPETKAAVDELINIRNLTYLLGNHDWWTLQWMRTGKAERVWYSQGGDATVRSYADGVPARHIEFFRAAELYHIDKNRLFVHAGIDPSCLLEDQTEDTFLWDRSLALRALDSIDDSSKENFTSFSEVYLGHTPVPCDSPVCSREVWLMDTGAGWSGVLSIMNVETKQVFTSDRVPALYPGVRGRQKF